MPCYLIDEKKNLTESLSLIKKTYNATITFTGTDTSPSYNMNMDSVSEFISDLQSEKLICANMISKSVGYSGNDSMSTELISPLTYIYPKRFGGFGTVYSFETKIFTVTSSIIERYETYIQAQANSMDTVFSFQTDEKLQGNLTLTSYRIDLYLWS